MLNEPHSSTYNIIRILKGYTKTVNCTHCGIILYTKKGGKGYSCWPCIRKNNPDSYNKRFKL